MDLLYSLYFCAVKKDTAAEIVKKQEQAKSFAVGAVAQGFILFCASNNKWRTHVFVIESISGFVLFS